MNYNVKKAFETIENELIESMIRNFSRHRAEETAEGYNWAQWQAKQLESLEEFRATNSDKYGKKFRSLNSKINEMISRAMSDGEAEQELKILEAIKKGAKISKPKKGTSGEFFKINKKKLDALITATTNDMQTAETAILRMSNDKYRKAIFSAQVYANSGAGTYEKAVDMACRDMLQAGLNCVEYKNGARHTLADYADMAIRTANKRAYLYGEGQKRAEWGLSLVVVNSRQGGCPRCAKYIGHLFVDDVYSNGTRTKENEKYPLLSSAISGGLFHPRCKDSTSTYYKGVTTLKPVNADELDEMERREEVENKLKFAKRQEKRFNRIAKFSLDKNNQQKAEARAKEWKEKRVKYEKALEKFSKNDTISLDKIVENTTKLKSAMNETDYNAFTKLLSNLKNDFVKKLYTKYADRINKIRPNRKGCYRTSENILDFNFPLQKYIDNGKSKFSTLAHEYAHFFDRQAEFEGLHFNEVDTILKNTKYQNGIITRIASSSDEFLEAVRKDKALLQKNLNDELRKELSEHDASMGVQDAIDGLLGERIRWGHGDKYYNGNYMYAKRVKEHRKIQKVYKELGFDASNLNKTMMEYRIFDASSEMWANIMSAEVNGGSELEYVKKYLPNSYNAMLTILKKVK